MGLDAVELVMDVEDHFGISIQNAEAEHVRTVVDLVALIQSRINAAHLAHCPTLVAFLKLRSFARDIASDDRLRVPTGTLLVDALDRSQRKRLWKRFGELLGSPPPGMRRPPLLRKALVGLAIASIACAVISAAMIDLAILPATLGLAALLILVLHLVTTPFRFHPPNSLSTFGALSRRVAGVTVATKLLHLSSGDAILAELTPIVVDTLGVDAAEVVPSALFIEDLGMG